LEEVIVEEKKDVVAAGGIVVRQGKRGIEVLLIQKKDSGAWTLPKGHLEVGEQLENCALREMTEETGLKVRLKGKAGQISYSYHRDGFLVHETVHYFLAEPLTFEEPSPDFHEVQQVVWLPLVEATQKLTYPNERDLLVKLKNILLGSSNQEN
jgi:8-oxo-dGTP pyrophosphatase MutT (NUDIX family)